MNKPATGVWYYIGLLAAVCAPMQAAVGIVSMRPSLASPQLIGTTIVWTVTATDSNTGPLTFRFNVASPGGSFALVKDFNVGTLNSGTWTSQPFAWTPTRIEGTYQIQVVIEDFTSGETTSQTARFQVTPLVSGSAPVAVPTANPLVALFSAPSCAKGSSMRVWFQPQAGGTGTGTSWAACHPPTTMTFEVAGMYPKTAYNMHSQTLTAGEVVNGATVSFTTGTLPATIPFPDLQTVIAPGAQSDTAESVILVTPLQFDSKPSAAAVAAKLSGRIIWYYYPSTTDHFQVITRSLPGGTFLSIQNDTAWDPATKQKQVFREVDLAGNIIRETNTGAIQQQLVAMGAIDGAACTSIPSPAPVGAGCLGSFHHDAIQTLPNGQTAILTDIEKIFPPGTQGDTSGLPVDVVGDMIVVLDANWQVAWYFDSFQHDGGGMQLDINRPAVLGELCVINQGSCPPMLLLGPGIAPAAKDWLHANSLYYNPQDGSILWSSRHQDWIMKVDYGNGSGTGNILWRMGQDGDFAIVSNDPWPWFSHQHDAGIENNGLGPLTVFDNGDTRVSPPPFGLGSGNSRGMALTVDEAGLQVTPAMSVDLGVYAQALGSAQLLPNGNYFFLAADVVASGTITSYSIEILPTAGTETGIQVFSLAGPQTYRAWRMPSLYLPPTT